MTVHIIDDQQRAQPDGQGYGWSIECTVTVITDLPLRSPVRSRGTVMVDGPADETSAELSVPSLHGWIGSERLGLLDWLGAIVSLRGAP